MHQFNEHILTPIYQATLIECVHIFLWSYDEANAYFYFVTANMLLFQK